LSVTSHERWAAALTARAATHWTPTRTDELLRGKAVAVRPAEGAVLLRALGILADDGTLPPGRVGKYFQVNHMIATARRRPWPTCARGHPGPIGIDRRWLRPLVPDDRAGLVRRPRLGSTRCEVLGDRSQPSGDRRASARARRALIGPRPTACGRGHGRSARSTSTRRARARWDATHGAAVVDRGGRAARVRSARPAHAIALGVELGAER
jgi:hypothetical protein